MIDICFFLLRCLINCEKTASVSTRISLTTTCTGHACDAATYQWQLVSLHPSNDTEIKESLTRDMTDTELNLPSIIIKANQLTGGFTYRLKVTATPGIGPAGNAAYQFGMNAPPHSGLCTVSPRTGEALRTKFDFRCTGWQVRRVNSQVHQRGRGRGRVRKSYLLKILPLLTPSCFYPKQLVLHYAI